MVHSLGADEERARIAARLGVEGDRIAIATSAAAQLALFYVLADIGDEILVASDPLALDVATISGLDAVSLDTLDAETLFEAASERTRAIVLGDAIDPDLLALLAELGLPIVCRDASIAGQPIFATESAPLAVLIGDGWLAVLGPADRAEPLITRLEWHAHVFFA